MPINKPRFVAVLTGDLVGSSSWPHHELSKVRSISEKTFREFKKHWRIAQTRDLTFYRGDEWQLALFNVRFALRLALLLRARMRSISGIEADTRVSIAIGQLNEFDPSGVAFSSGEAFTLSGRRLDSLKRQNLAISLPVHFGWESRWIEASVLSCGHLVDKWTTRQAEINALALTIGKTTQTELGKRLTPQVRQQTVADSFHGSNWNIIENTVEVFEETDWPKLLLERQKNR